MHRLIRRLGVAALVAVTTNVHAGLLEKGFRASYDASFKGLHMGIATRLLEPLGEQRWSFRSAIDPAGLVKLLLREDITERSEFRLVNGEVLPVSYSYERSKRPDKSYQLQFDWEADQMRVLPQQKVMEIPRGTQDNLSFLIAVMRKLQAGEVRFTMTVAGRKRLRDHRVEPRGEEFLDTPLGRVRTQFLIAQEVGKDTRYELWCAPDYDFLPIKVRQVKEDDGTIELVIRRIEGSATRESRRSQPPQPAGAG